MRDRRKQTPACFRDARRRALSQCVQSCLACAHACSEKTIGLTVPEENPHARYRNEHVSLKEIIEANPAN